MNEELTKSLTDLIDETLMELEELKKSSRFSAAEIEIKGPGEGIAGKPSDGKLDAAKAEDKKDEEDKDEDEDKAEKADSEEDPADAPDVGRKLKELTEKAEKEDKKDEDKEEKKEDKKDEKSDEKPTFPMKKSEEELSSLMKSYIDERVKPLEDKLSSIFDMVHKIAEQPVAPKGATARTIPLMKSSDEGSAGELLSKAEVAAKLFDLKKSGSHVDSLDVTKAEMGQDLSNLVKKYKLS